LRGCTILKYVPLPDDGNTEYIGFIPFTDDEPRKIAVVILCLKDCKTMDTESIFTSEYLEEDSPCSKQKLDEDSSVIQPESQSL
jgi:hypothetical protein